MSLLHQIQESIVQENSDLGSVLLKLQLLASRLGSNILEEWVKHESEGYPNEVNVPPYRLIKISHRGTFSGPFGSGIKNAQIPPYLIEQHAGIEWNEREMRESIVAVGNLIKSSDEGSRLSIDASNLILLLGGKIYQGYSCVEIQASISPTALTEIQQAVRSRVLELTLELEKAIPAAALVTFGAPKKEVYSSEKVQQISQQIIYGDVANAVASGSGSSISLTINEKDNTSFIDYLVKSGVPENDAVELVEIMEGEEPSNPEEPFGNKAKDWLVVNLKKAAEGTWDIGISVATKILTEAAKKYYGL